MERGGGGSLADGHLLEYIYGKFEYNENNNTNIEFHKKYHREVL